MEKYRSVEMFSPIRSAQSPSMSPFRSPLQSPLTSRRYSSTIDEDETALRWAAIEKLPIFEQLRTSVLREEVQTENGKKKFEHKEVDVRNLALVERRQFIERIFKVAEEDNERFLKKLRSRIDKVGIQLPTVQVRFERLTVRTQCYVGTRALPTLFNTTRNTIELILGSLGIGINKKTNLTILKDASGIINPSRMTLLLGPPASGKTTLLLALAGKLDPALESSGEVTYNGYQLNQFVSQKTAAYISQHDLHAGEMTVKETLDFSARCQGVGPRHELLNELAKREKEAGIFPDAEVDLFMKATAQGGIKSSLQTDYTLRILGLDICADTIVGDEMLRGISGGQKKRLTTGEMIVGPTKTLFMDEISTGLDSSTTFQIVKCLQQIVHLGEATILMSLLQPAPETFELFDDIILLSEGQIVYHGPREYVLDFFQSCGFRCPERKSSVDFVQEVTSRKDQEQYWADKSKPYRYISVSDFVKRFKRFHIGLSLQNELSMPFDKKKNHEAALTFSRRLVPTSELLSASFSKEWLLITRNSFVYIFKIVQLVIVAIIASTVFLRTKMPLNNEADGAHFSGALIYGVIVNMFNGFAELSFAIMRLPVFYKHRDLLLYPAWVFTFPNVVLRIPIAIVESFIWVCMTYYSIGFAPEASRFFKMLLIIILISQTAAGLFRVVAGVFRSHVVANAGGTIIFLLFFVLGGFIQPKDKIPKWWSWGYWISPFPYAYNAVAVNEFFSARWMDKITPDGRRLGAAILENNSIPVNENWYWIGAGALLAYSVICNVIFTITLSYLNPPGRQQAVISEETAMEMEDNYEDESDESPRLKRTWSSRVSTPRSLSANDGNNTPETRKRRLGGYSGTASPKDFRSYESSANYETSGMYPSKKGMVLPFTPLAMSFRDVNYYVDMPAEMKAQGVTEERLQLLKGVTSAFRPGVLTALMGVSGAGKTTLMDVLAGRKTGGYIEGDIRISGFRKNQATFARISGYCEQNDIHSPQVTIKESLIYSAFLRLPQLVTNEEKMKFVDEVMNLVELDTIQDAIVGLPGVTGLSTEQRKRLTIAVELVANPSIIFMDEPTSGLDARAAAVVMRTVRSTVDTGRTVVCTIHQPSIDIFESFDELLLLKRGGQVIYSGSLGKNSCKMIEYFESIPGVPKHYDKCNPATWMLDASSVATEVRLGIDFADLYKSSSLYRRNKALVKGLKKPLPGTSDLYFTAQYAQSDYQQFKSCLWKQWWTYWRSPDYNLVRFSFCWFTGLLLGSIFWDIGHTRESSLDFTMIIGAMYAAILFAGFNNASTVQPVVVVERMVFYRERAAGMYSALPYAFAQMIVELPYVFLQTLVYDLILYSMLGFEWTLVKFSWFFFASFFTFLYFTYYGMMCVAISPNLQVAMLISATFYTLFNLFSGFFVAKASIPKWWIWYYWICPVAWTVNGLVTPQFGDLDDIIRVPGQQNQTIKAYIDDQFGFNLDFIGAVAGVLVGFTLLFAFVFAYGIKKMNFQQR